MLSSMYVLYGHVKNEEEEILLRCEILPDNCAFQKESQYMFGYV